MGRHWEASAAFAKAIEGSPDDPLLYRNLGFSHLMAREWEEASEVFSRAAAPWPSRAWTHSYLGEALYRQKRYGEAAGALREALRREPSLFHAFYYLGFVQVALGHKPLGLQLFQDLLARSPEGSRREIRGLIVRLEEAIAAQGRQPLTVDR